MLPAKMFTTTTPNLSPPFVHLPGDNVILPTAEMAFGALTPHKRATTEQHSSVPVAKRLQLEACNDLSSGTPPTSLDNNNIFNRATFIPDDTVKNPNDTNHIAGTPAFITTLMKFIKFSDEKRQESINKTNMAHPPLLPTFASSKSPTPVMMMTSSVPKNNVSASVNSPPFGMTPTLLEGKKTPNCKLPSIGSAMITSSPTFQQSSYLPSMDLTIPQSNKPDSDMEEDCVFDDDDCLLNNLPTSVDDLQDKEKQIKMERHFSSPLMSHRHTPSYYDAGRLSAASHASYPCDGTHSAASIHPEEEFDADDLEVAMINESFEEQQRQYKLYCGDKLKSAFYSAPEEVNASKVEPDSLMVYPLPVPDTDDTMFTNDTLYSHWKEDSPISAYDIITKPIVNDIFNNICPYLDDDDDSIPKSAMASLHPSIPESMDSLKLYNTSLRSDVSPPQPSFTSADDSFIDSEKDAMATVLSSANFVLDELDSPQLVEDDSRNASPLLMKSPSAIPPSHDNNLIDDDDSEDEAELIMAWKENKTVVGDSVRYYFPRLQATPLPPPLLDKIEEPPKNIKCLAHVTELYNPNGELDTEPALRYFQSIGMKNFYQRDIDIQRAFLVFSTIEDAKIAVENNNTGLQLRLLEESPQFVKLKALKMYFELRPIGNDKKEEKRSAELCLPWPAADPIAGV